MWYCILNWIEAHPGLAAWLQGLGTTLALAIAVLVPLYQHRSELAVRREEADQQRTSIRQRLTVGLIAEIGSIDEVLASLHETAAMVWARLEKAVMDNRPIDTGDIPANGLRITDAALYRAVTRDLGVLPPTLIKSTVAFYTLIAQVERTSDMSTDFEGVIDVQRKMIPRLRMSGRFLLIALKRYQEAGFPDDISIQPTNAEARKAAEEVHYPLDEIATKLGVKVKG